MSSPSFPYVPRQPSATDCAAARSPFIWGETDFPLRVHPMAPLPAMLSAGSPPLPPPPGGSAGPDPFPTNSPILLPRVPAAPMWRVSKCLDYLQVGKTKFYAWMNPKSKFFSPSFPSPVYLGGGRIPYWKPMEVIAWVDQQAGKSDKPLAAV